MTSRRFPSSVAGLISERTKAALAMAKQGGVKLGGFKGVAVDTKLGTQALVDKADERARDYALVISDIRDAGISTFTGIAAESTAVELQVRAVGYGRRARFGE